MGLPRWFDRSAPDDLGSLRAIIADLHHIEDEARSAIRLALADSNDPERTRAARTEKGLLRHAMDLESKLVSIIEHEQKRRRNIALLERTRNTCTHLHHALIALRSSPNSTVKKLAADFDHELKRAKEILDPFEAHHK